MLKLPKLGKNGIINIMELKGIGAGYRRKLTKVLSALKGLMTPELVSEVLGVSPQEGGRILSRWSRQGWVKRLKRGVYSPVAIDDITGELTTEDPWVVGDKLFGPGYIGGFSAVKHWDFSEQIFETVTYLTTKKVKDRHPVIGETRFHLKTIGYQKKFGTKTVWKDNVKILVSDPSKTIVDILDDPSLVGGMRIVKDIFTEYLESEFFNIKLLISYCEKIGNKTTFKRLGFLMETMGKYKEIAKYRLEQKISKGYSTFDSLMENTLIVRKWGLKVPENWKKEYDRKK